VKSYDGSAFRWPNGELISQREWIDSHRLNHALTVHQKSGLLHQATGSSAGSFSVERVYRALAFQCGLPFVDLNHFTIRVEAIRALPKEIIYRYKLIPVIKNEDRLIVAVSHPRSRLLVPLLKSWTHILDVQVVMACPEAMEKVIRNYYGDQFKAA